MVSWSVVFVVVCAGLWRAGNGFYFPPVLTGPNDKLLSSQSVARGPPRTHTQAGPPLLFHHPLFEALNVPASPFARDRPANRDDNSSEEEAANGPGSAVPNAVAIDTGALETAKNKACCLGLQPWRDTLGYEPVQRIPMLPLWDSSTSQFTGLNITTIRRGSPNSRDYRVFFQNEAGPISPFHDIPLYANEGNKIFNMVVEVPRWTNAKMEISTKESLNPIKQDVKKGKLRYVANCFPHHGYIWNYGALPQTWEDPNHVDEATGCKGDNDPIDVCEIGYRVAKRGDVIQVKVLGTIALIDEGETDWKLIAIDVNDPMAPQLSDIGDVEKHMPGFLKATVEWFKIYKMPDGKPENQFAFNADAKDRDFAHKIIMETHEAWQGLVEGKADAGGLSIDCVKVPQATSQLTALAAQTVVDSTPEAGTALPIDPKVDTWHYVSLK